MPVSQFKEKFVDRLKIDPIPENILNENDFEQNFVMPIALDINKPETDVFLFSHPWGKKVRCTPDCKNARDGKGHIQEGCCKCWNESKDWGTVDAFGTKNNFDLVVMDAHNGKLAVEIKFLSFAQGRKPNGEIQRFLGQCALAASKFDFVVGVCGYVGKINPKYDRDTENFMRWAEEKNINLIFRSVSTEKYQNFEIEWIEIPSFKLCTPSGEFNNICGHGVELVYKNEKQSKVVGFIEGYQWYHKKRGPCRVYILSQDSKEWGKLISETELIMREIKESVYDILQRGQLGGRVKGNIHALANA